jgi:hypothetical protein
MSLTPRHHWCIGHIKQCFQDQLVVIDDCDSYDSILFDFMQEAQVLNKFHDLFSGKGRNVLFVHYQQQQEEQEQYQDEQEMRETLSEAGVSIILYFYHQLQKECTHIVIVMDLIASKQRGCISLRREEPKFLISHGDTLPFLGKVRSWWS